MLHDIEITYRISPAVSFLKYLKTLSFTVPVRMIAAECCHSVEELAFLHAVCDQTANKLETSNLISRAKVAS